MSNLPAVEATKRAVHDTRTRVLLSKTKMTSIAEACGRNRMTVAKWLDGDDISLAAYIAAQQLSGGDPIETLANALNADNTDPALAAENIIPALAEGGAKRVDIRQPLRCKRRGVVTARSQICSKLMGHPGVQYAVTSFPESASLPLKTTPPCVLVDVVSFWEIACVSASSNGPISSSLKRIFHCAM